MSSRLKNASRLLNFTDIQGVHLGLTHTTVRFTRHVTSASLEGYSQDKSLR